MRREWTNETLIIRPEGGRAVGDIRTYPGASTGLKISTGDVPLKSIQLQTKLGNDIENGQCTECSNYEVGSYKKLCDKYKNVTRRTGLNPAYNCHGLTFASRRTGVTEVADIRKILEEDGYEIVLEAEALPGDVVVYYGEGHEPEHSGIVVESPSKNDLGFPMILSKWGKGFECIHSAYNTPYDQSCLRYYRVK